MYMNCAGEVPKYQSAARLEETDTTESVWVLHIWIVGCLWLHQPIYSTVYLQHHSNKSLDT
jgi:hypothetical protein